MASRPAAPERSNSGFSRIPRGTSNVLRRGATLSLESPSSQMAGTTSLVASASPSKDANPVMDAEGESLSQTAPLPSEEPCGLTPASLKHLRRQRDALSEEKGRLQAELQEATKQLKELKPQVASLTAQFEEAVAARVELETEVASQRQRAERAEELCAKLEALVAEKEAEIERLRKGLEDQQKLTQEVCEAADRRDQQASEQTAAQVADLQEMVRKLKLENQQLLQEQQLQAKRHEEMARSVAVAMAAAEKAMAMHAQHTSQLETLRNAKLAEAINSKVELHIAVPKVTLTYNNAPPLLVSVAAGLGEGKLETFLNKEVFPHFEPLWVRLDGLDKAPDGSSKKAYSSRMLDRLTQAVKTFLVRSQSEGDGKEGHDEALETGRADRLSQ
ncbi:unnamed protein product, partial [Symbiodinium natans]